MTTEEKREGFSGSAKESQACLFVCVCVWGVDATGGKITAMRQGKGADTTQRAEGQSVFVQDH